MQKSTIKQDQNGVTITIKADNLLSAEMEVVYALAEIVNRLEDVYSADDRRTVREVLEGQ